MAVKGSHPGRSKKAPKGAKGWWFRQEVTSSAVQPPDGGEALRLPKVVAVQASHSRLMAVQVGRVRKVVVTQRISSAEAVQVGGIRNEDSLKVTTVEGVIGR